MALQRAGVPESAEEAALLADAAARATAHLREWVSVAQEQQMEADAGTGSAFDEHEWTRFTSHLNGLAQEFLALHLKVLDVGSDEDSDPLAGLRYAIAKRAFSSDAEMANELRVHRSQITRWKQGAAPDAQNAEKLVGLDVVVSLLQGFLETESIPKWLRGINAHLGNRRPLDVLREGRLSEVIRAIEAEREGAFA